MSPERERQLERTREVLAEKNREARAKAEEQEISSTDRTAEDQDVRAKSTGEGEKTADN